MASNKANSGANANEQHAERELDDVYIATLNGSVLDLLDLERVEVLRGPQGTLTGRNSIGGAVKLFSRKLDGSDGRSSHSTSHIRSPASRLPTAFLPVKIACRICVEIDDTAAADTLRSSIGSLSEAQRR